MRVRKLVSGVALSGCLAAGAHSVLAADIADVAIVIDESGSMSGEHSWIGSAISSLETSLIANGIGGSGTSGNRYALVGFGSSSTSTEYLGVGIDDSGRGNTAWMSSTQFGSAVNSLLLDGGIEDGYSGMNYFFSGYTPRSSAALNVILITDEDRDDEDPSLTYNSMLSEFTSRNALLNVVVDSTFTSTPSTGSAILGIDADGNGYVEDGSGGYTTVSNASASSGFGTTIADYVDLALDTGGAAWDLDQLRAGGDTAASFTSAFTAIKTQEISTQEPTGVPLPGSLALLGIGVLAFGFNTIGRRKHQ